MWKKHSIYWNIHFVWRTQQSAFGRGSSRPLHRLLSQHNLSSDHKADCDSWCSSLLIEFLVTDLSTRFSRHLTSVSCGHLDIPIWCVHCEEARRSAEDSGNRECWRQLKIMNDSWQSFTSKKLYMLFLVIKSTIYIYSYAYRYSHICCCCCSRQYDIIVVCFCVCFQLTYKIARRYL